MEIKCPYCGSIIEDDPFDMDDEVYSGDMKAYSTEHYDCDNCNHWFTVFLTYKLELENIEYQKRGKEE